MSPISFNNVLALKCSIMYVYVIMNNICFVTILKEGY